MIEVSEAVKIINEAQLNLPATTIPLEKAIGRVLRQDIFADTDFPPFDRVMMDGIAIRWSDFEQGLRTYQIAGTQAAGLPQMKLKNDGGCLEVMTGAMMPEGADLVIPYEDIEIDQRKNEATVLISQTAPGKNIHKKGSDKKQGDRLVTSGTLIGTPEIAIAASVGQTELMVTKNPSIAILATGNELVGIDQKPQPHQIRRSNVYALAAELRRLGLKSDLYHVMDDKENLRLTLIEMLAKHEVILLSGGVSMGKFDFVPEVLESLGVEKKFHRISQKPGKPFFFGVLGQKNVVFAFPGNPVSTFLCFHKYFLPWLKRCLGVKDIIERKAVLSMDFSIKANLTFFLQVITHIDHEGRLIATPVMGRGSGDHANLLVSNAFLELPAGKNNFKKGEVFNLIPFREI
jgi:molybdopterin molybdotransferase